VVRLELEDIEIIDDELGGESVSFHKKPLLIYTQRELAHLRSRQTDTV
jgi:hypothetical protein